MQFSKSPPLFLPCTPADNDANHSYEKDFRKFSLSSYHGVVAAGRTLWGWEGGMAVRRQRYPPPTLHVPADVYAGWCELTHTVRMRLFATVYTSLAMLICSRCKSVAANLATRCAVIHGGTFETEPTVLKRSVTFCVSWQ